MSVSRKRVNIFYRLVIVFSAVFIATILALVATILGDANAPITRFLNQYGSGLILGEVVVTLLTGALAMIVDRRQILRQMQTDDESPRRPAEVPRSPKPADDDSREPES